MKCIMNIMALLFCSVVLMGQEKKPVVFYLRNLPIERIGEYSDARIKADLWDEGFLVLDVDCSVFPKTSPELEEALMCFHIGIPELLQQDAEKGLVDLSAVYYVPEGYTITRNIPVWNIKEHGADGSVEWVMDTWNSHIVSRYGMSPVSAPEQMTNPDGSPLDWNLYMDIIHPSGKASDKVPLLLTFGSASPRISSFKPVGPIGRQYRSIFPLGFLTTGYAFAVADHCYNPLARSDSWKHFRQYTLDDFNGLASSTAFVRYLRTHMDTYNLDGKIGVMGISKASYSAVRVADSGNQSGEEFLLFNGRPNDRLQPWSAAGSRVDVAYAAAGIGSERAFRFVGEQTVPMLTSAGLTDEYNQWEVYPEVVRAMTESDHNHLAFWMEDMGHTFPCMGVDAATGEARYVLFKRFFDHYLKSPSSDVLYALPASAADIYGYSRILPEENLLPKDHSRQMRPYWANEFAEHYAGFTMRHATGENKFVFFNRFYETFLKGMNVNWPVLSSDDVFYGDMQPLEAYAPITIRFCEPYQLSEIEKYVKIAQAVDSTSVTGIWRSSMNGTCFTFYPSEPLCKGHEYIISVPYSITSKAGRKPNSHFIKKFIVD